jgi:hypothetical protein
MVCSSSATGASNGRKLAGLLAPGRIGLLSVYPLTRRLRLHRPKRDGPTPQQRPKEHEISARMGNVLVESRRNTLAQEALIGVYSFRPQQHRTHLASVGCDLACVSLTLGPSSPYCMYHVCLRHTARLAGSALGSARVSCARSRR